MDTWNTCGRAGAGSPRAADRSGRYPRRWGSRKVPREEREGGSLPPSRTRPPKGEAFAPSLLRVPGSCWEGSPLRASPEETGREGRRRRPGRGRLRRGEAARSPRPLRCAAARTGSAGCYSGWRRPPQEGPVSDLPRPLPSPSADADVG